MAKSKVYSATFDLICRAILERKQLVCRYDGYLREVCPHILGHSKNVEKVQVYQFAGDTSDGPIPAGGDYKCFDVAKIEAPVLRDGPWHGDEKHKYLQQCVKAIYLHIDLSVGNQPGRRRKRRIGNDGGT